MSITTVGVDLDDHNGYKMLCTFLNANRLGVASAFYTRHGFHVEVELVEPVDHATALTMRYMLGDCPDRLRVDEHRVAEGVDLVRFDTLFDTRLKGGVTYRRRRFDPLEAGLR